MSAADERAAAAAERTSCRSGTRLSPELREETAALHHGRGSLSRLAPSPAAVRRGRDRPATWQLQARSEPPLTLRRR